MDDKSLQDKAVNIKGKQYVLVSDRVRYFNEKYPEGQITTQLVSSPDDQRVIVKALVLVGPANAPRSFTGHSQAVIGEGMVNKTAALENAETSAVGRALAFMGIGVIDSVASADELNKALSAPERPKIAPGATKPAKTDIDRQKGKIIDLLMELDGAINTTKEARAARIKKLTELDPSDENLGEIIDRLTHLADEARNK